ncbi:MAG: hypothetical protein IPK87_14070 [Planctomycetes bacterium]|nr:hypothetical protein [Planctomycetota bacterium]
MARLLILLALAAPLAAQSESTLIGRGTLPPAATVPQGALEVPALAFNLLRSTATSDDTFSGLQVRNAGTGGAAEYVRVRLWLDADGDGAFDPTSDTPLSHATGAFPASFGAFDAPQLIMNGQMRGYILTLDVSPNASAGATFRLEVQPADVTMGTHPVALAEPGLEATGNTLTVAANGDPRMAVITQPSGAHADQAFLVQPVVELLDAAGQRVVADSTTVVTASIAPGTGAQGASLGPPGALTATVSSGVATFSGLKISAAGSGYSLMFTAANHSATITASFDVGAVALTLVVTRQPAGATAGKPFATQPVVEVRDAQGAVAPSSVAVAATLSSGSGTLSGNAQVNAINGVVTFTDLAIDKPGTYRLEFTAPGAQAAQSQSFSVNSSKPESKPEEKTGWFGCAAQDRTGSAWILASLLGVIALARRRLACSKRAG